MSNQLSLCERLSQCPNNILYNKLNNAQAKVDVNCIEYSDLLSDDIEKALELTFVVDPQWLVEQYTRKGITINGNLTILYETVNGQQSPENYKINHTFVQTPNYGTHHTKMGLYKYRNGDLRIVLSTANLTSASWENCNQQLWVSPRLPECSNEAPYSDGKYNFKGDLINYLQSYEKNPSLTTFFNEHLQTWVDSVRRANCASIDVFFIASAPHTDITHIDGLSRASQKIKSYFQKDKTINWQIIIQTSSISKMETSTNLLDYFARKMDCLDLKIIYPTEQQARNSVGAGCLFYPSNIHEEQCWLKKFLYKWSSEHLGRTNNMSHVKSYCCLSLDYQQVKWYLLTSANITRAAWGWPYLSQFSSPAYEAGVLFIEPKNIPFMYDLPLTKYDEMDEPYQS